MSTYAAIDQLTQDPIFGGRVRSCTVQQAETFQNDQRPDFVAVAAGCLRGDGTLYLAFIRMTAAGPNGSAADNGDGTIEQGKVGDADILSAVQAYWPVVAGLFFDDTGAPIQTGATP
jgi:hypothetical protein